MFVVFRLMRDLSNDIKFDEEYAVPTELKQIHKFPTTNISSLWD